jgi:hypothetical protein
VKSNGTDIVDKAHGIVIDIMNELARKLNFTYVLHLTQASLDTNSTDELTNATVSAYCSGHM